MKPSNNPSNPLINRINKRPHHSYARRNPKPGSVADALQALNDVIEQAIEQACTTTHQPIDCELQATITARILTSLSLPENEWALRRVTGSSVR